MTTTTTTVTMTSKPQAGNFSGERRSRLAEGESQKRKVGDNDDDEDDQSARGIKEESVGYEHPKKRMSMDGDLSKGTVLSVASYSSKLSNVV